MKSYCCRVCGYVSFGNTPPKVCKMCGADENMFDLQNEAFQKEYVAEHVIGIARNANTEIIDNLKNCYIEDSLCASKYMAMSRQADRDGFPEIASAFRRYSIEKLEHSAKLLELLRR